MASPAPSFQRPSPTAAFNALYSSVLLRVNSLNIDHDQKPYLVFTFTKLQSLAEPMASLVADFLVNPVIRQAQRIRSGSINSNEDESESESARLRQTSLGLEGDVPLDEDAISETDEALALLSSLHGDAAGSHESLREATHALTRAASQTDVVPRRPSQTSVHIFMPDEDVTPGSSASVIAAERSGTSTPSTVASNQKPQPIPEDDGMGSMRRRILEIQAQDADPSHKARLMHQLFQENYSKIQVASEASRPRPTSPVTSWQQRLPQGPLESLKFWQNANGEISSAETITLTEEDVRPTYVPCGMSHCHGEDENEAQPFGCEHYMRNVKLQCSTCARWYTCRFCHDAVEDHELIRKDTKNMLCMPCGTAQRAGDSCVACGESAASYYCDICKLWNNDRSKDIYHCEDCGICRIGMGIGKDFFHCKKCRACIAIYKQKDHKCVERATDCDCPICGEYMFTSLKPVGFLDCGHSIHQECFTQHMRTSYRCPICNKSAINMEYQFRNLDRAIEAQPMPPEFSQARAIVLCNDCSAKSQTHYHWLGLKCGVCRSYNTAQLQVIGMENVGSSQRPEGLPPAAPTNSDSVPTVPRITVPNEITRSRRHSSSAVESPATGLHRLQISGRPHRSSSWDNSVCNTPLDLDEEEEEEHFMGFWNRIPRGIISSEATDAESDAETESSSEEEELEEDDEEDADDWEIFGHR